MPNQVAIKATMTQGPIGPAENAKARPKPPINRAMETADMVRLHWLQQGVSGCGLPVCTEFAESGVFVVEVMGHRDRGQQMSPLGFRLLGRTLL